MSLMVRLILGNSVERFLGRQETSPAKITITKIGTQAIRGSLKTVAISALVKVTTSSLILLLFELLDLHSVWFTKMTEYVYFLSKIVRSIYPAAWSFSCLEY